MQVLPDEFKTVVTTKWNEYIDYVVSLPEFAKGNDPYWEISARGTVEFLNKQSLTSLLPDTITEWETWDEIRSERWYQALPELNFLKEYRKNNE